MPRKTPCAYFSFVLFSFYKKKLCKCQLLGDTTLKNFDYVCMKVRARWFLKDLFKNLLQILV